MVAYYFCLISSPALISCSIFSAASSLSALFKNVSHCACTYLYSMSFFGENSINISHTVFTRQPITSPKPAPQNKRLPCGGLLQRQHGFSLPNIAFGFKCYCAVQICAENLQAPFIQGSHGICMRVAERIRPDTDHRRPGRKLIQKRRQAGQGAAVVGYF